MKLKLLNRTRSSDDEIDGGHADDSMRNSGKISVEASSIDSSSHDTTENMTDTDNSSQIKSDDRRRRSSTAYNHNHLERKSTTSTSDTDSGKRKVRFAMNAIETYDVESHLHFSSKERSKYWWSDREKDRMMAKHERLVAKYEQQRSGSKSTGSKKGKSSVLQSYRGLESWTAAGSLKLDYTIEQCITAVMDEQDRQWSENADDADIIAKKSMEVTGDSARRARLNGLQDAQEALRVRGEIWGLKGDGDDMSVGSSVSAGTSAIAKKNKRKKLMARLDDSHKPSKNANKEDVLSSLKKSSKEKKKKKKKKASKEKKTSKKSKDKIRTTISDPASADATKRTVKECPSEDDALSTAETEVAPKSLVSSVLAGPEIPISPLSTHDPVNGSSNTNECPLLTTLRRQQEQLRRESMGLVDRSQIATNPSLEQEDGGMEGDNVSPLLETLRRQQKQQASKWQLELNDDRSSSSGRTPVYTGGLLTKCSSLRLDASMASNAPADSSDPPGRRPRRLQSKHVEANTYTIPEESTSSTKQRKHGRSRSKSRTRNRSKSRDRSLMSKLDSSNRSAASEEIEFPDSSGSVSSAGKKGFDRLRNGAKILFNKKGAK